MTLANQDTFNTSSSRTLQSKLSKIWSIQVKISSKKDKFWCKCAVWSLARS